MDSKGPQLYIYMYSFSPKLPSHPDCHITLDRVPCAKYVAGPCWLSILNIALITKKVLGVLCVCMHTHMYTWVCIHMHVHVAETEEDFLI